MITPPKIVSRLFCYDFYLIIFFSLRKRSSLHVDRTRYAFTSKTLQQIFWLTTRNCHSYHSRTCWWTWNCKSYVFLGKLPSWGKTFQSQIQVGESYTSPYGGKTLSLSLSWVRKSVRTVRKPQNTQKDTHG